MIRLLCRWRQYKYLNRGQIRRRRLALLDQVRSKERWTKDNLLCWIKQNHRKRWAIIRALSSIMEMHLKEMHWVHLITRLITGLKGQFNRTLLIHKCQIISSRIRWAEVSHHLYQPDKWRVNPNNLRNSLNQPVSSFKIDKVSIQTSSNQGEGLLILQLPLDRDQDQERVEEVN